MYFFPCWLVAKSHRPLALEVGCIYSAGSSCVGHRPIIYQQRGKKLQRASNGYCSYSSKCLRFHFKVKKMGTNTDKKNPRPAWMARQKVQKKKQLQVDFCQCAVNWLSFQFSWGWVGGILFWQVSFWGQVHPENWAKMAIGSPAGICRS